MCHAAAGYLSELSYYVTPLVFRIYIYVTKIDLSTYNVQAIIAGRDIILWLNALWSQQ